MKILTVDTLGAYLGGLYEPSTIRSLLTRDPSRLPPPLELGGKQRKRKIWLSVAVDAWLFERLKVQSPSVEDINQQQVEDITNESAALESVLKRKPGRPRKLEAASA